MSDAHDSQVGKTDWRYKVHLVAGFARRSRVRVDAAEKIKEVLRAKAAAKASGSQEVPAKRERQEIQDAAQQERKKRRSELLLPSVPPLPKPVDATLTVQACLDENQVQGAKARRTKLCTGLLQALYKSKIPLYASRSLFPWLKDNVKDGGFLPSTETALQETRQLAAACP